MSAPSSKSVGVGGIDWVKHWYDLVEHRRIVIEGLASQGPQTGFWDQRAGRFAQRVAAQNARTDPLTQGILRLVRPTDTVLDVGAGTGRYAMPLAAAVARVTAVEPSEAMRQQLGQAMEGSVTENVAVVASTWQDAVVEPHDVVLCANVFYPIADAVPF